jgi:hypothetical protein
MMTEEDDRFFSLEKRRQDPKATASFFLSPIKKKQGRRTGLAACTRDKKGVLFYFVQDYFSPMRELFSRT